MSIFCGSRCQDRKDKRLELKYGKKIAKIDSRDYRTTTKQDTKKVAYSYGINPDEAKWGAITSLGSQVIGGATSILTGGATSFFNKSGSNASGGHVGQQQTDKYGQPIESGNTILYVAAGIAALLLLKR